MVERYWMYWMFWFGLGAGVALTLVFAYAPMRTMAKSTANNRAEIKRILGSVRAAAHTNLADALGALDEAQHAYIPVYPGNTRGRDDPDPTWLAWLQEADLDYWAPRRPAKPRWPTAALIVALAALWYLGRLRYPWWQRLADRVWEATAPIAFRLRQTLVSSHVWWVTITASVPLSAHRPKRYYPIK